MELKGAGSNWYGLRRTLSRVIPRGALPRLAWIFVAAGAAVGCLVGYTAVRDARTADPVAKAQQAQGPGGPDTSLPGWDRPLRDEEAAAMRYEQTVNGIKLIPHAGDPAAAVCQPGTAHWAAADDADKSALAVPASSLPPEAVPDPAL